jgi:hypothetical protein
MPVGKSALSLSGRTTVCPDALLKVALPPVRGTSACGQATLQRRHDALSVDAQRLMRLPAQERSPCAPPRRAAPSVVLVYRVI